jgi:hypothetical protein
MTYETEINKALRELKAQGIPVSDAILGTEGFVHNVMDVMLTSSQIVELRSEGNLNPAGIRAFKKNFESKRRLKLRETGRSHEKVLGSGPVNKWAVEPLPHGSEITIANFDGPNAASWRILRTNSGVMGEWTGNYKTADEALEVVQNESG